MSKGTITKEVEVVLCEFCYKEINTRSSDYCYSDINKGAYGDPKPSGWESKFNPVHFIFKYKRYKFSDEYIRYDFHARCFDELMIKFIEERDRKTMSDSDRRKTARSLLEQFSNDIIWSVDAHRLSEPCVDYERVESAVETTLGEITDLYTNYGGDASGDRLISDENIGKLIDMREVLVNSVDNFIGYSDYTDRLREHISDIDNLILKLVKHER